MDRFLQVSWHSTRETDGRTDGGTEVGGGFWGGFTGEMGAAAFAERLVAAGPRFEAVEAIRASAVEGFTARCGGMLSGGGGAGGGGRGIWTQRGGTKIHGSVHWLPEIAALGPRNQNKPGLCVPNPLFARFDLPNAIYSSA